MWSFYFMTSTWQNWDYFSDLGNPSGHHSISITLPFVTSRSEDMHPKLNEGRTAKRPRSVACASLYRSTCRQDFWRLCENESSATESSFIIFERSDHNPFESRSNEPKEKLDICRFCDLIWKLALYPIANRRHKVNFELTLHTSL